MHCRDSAVLRPQLCFRPPTPPGTVACLLSAFWSSVTGGARAPTVNATLRSEWARPRDRETAKALQARFVISVGDNFYEDGVKSVTDPAWRKSFENIYEAPSLQIPWHIGLGNHDYRGSVQAQIDYTGTSARWRLPARGYSFQEQTPDKTAVQFFITDTTPLTDFYYQNPLTRRGVEDQKHRVDAQLAWLDAALARSRAQWKIVVGHHPVYSGWIEPRRKLSPANPYFVLRTLGGTPDLMARVDPILRRHRVPLYLNGHNHDLQYMRMGSTNFVCTGAGSKIGTFCDLGGAEFCALRSGFVACTVDRERLRVAYRDYTGARLDVVDVRSTV